MLEPSCLSKVAELKCADPEFKRFLFISRGSDAMFRILTVHGVNLLCHAPGTGC